MEFPFEQLDDEAADQLVDAALAGRSGVAPDAAELIASIHRLELPVTAAVAARHIAAAAAAVGSDAPARPTRRRGRRVVATVVAGAFVVGSGIGAAARIGNHDDGDAKPEPTVADRPSTPAVDGHGTHPDADEGVDGHVDGPENDDLPAQANQNSAEGADNADDGIDNADDRVDDTPAATVTSPTHPESPGDDPSGDDQDEDQDDTTDEQDQDQDKSPKAKGGD